MAHLFTRTSKSGPSAVRARRRFAPRLATVLIAITLLALPASASGQNDAGSGGDAADAPLDAQTVTASNWTGTIDPAAGDRHDCYRIVSDPIQGRRVHVALTTDLTLRVYDGQGEFLDASFSSGTMAENVEVAKFSAYIVCVDLDGFSPTVTGSYTITITSFELPDLAVTAVRIGEPREPTDHGPTVRMVEVDVENRGRGPGEVYWAVSVHHEGPTASGRPLGDSWGWAEAGEKATITLEWETLGEIGDAEVRARVYSLNDVDESNNERSERANVLLKNSPATADATHQGTPVAALGVDVHAWDNFTTWSLQTFLPLNIVRANGWIDREHVDAFTDVCVSSLLTTCVGV